MDDLRNTRPHGKKKIMQVQNLRTEKKTKINKTENPGGSIEVDGEQMLEMQELEGKHETFNMYKKGKLLGFIVREPLIHQGIE